jgi:hypothetical protein
VSEENNDETEYKFSPSKENLDWNEDKDFSNLDDRVNWGSSWYDDHDPENPRNRKGEDY